MVVDGAVSSQVVDRLFASDEKSLDISTRQTYYVLQIKTNNSMRLILVRRWMWSLGPGRLVVADLVATAGPVAVKSLELESFCQWEVDNTTHSVSISPCKPCGILSVTACCKKSYAKIKS